MTKVICDSAGSIMQCKECPYAFVHEKVQYICKPKPTAYPIVKFQAKIVYIRDKDKWRIMMGYLKVGTIPKHISQSFHITADNNKIGVFWINVDGSINFERFAKI